jgi:hypothetical protein
VSTKKGVHVGHTSIFGEPVLLWSDALGVELLNGSAQASEFIPAVSKGKLGNDDQQDNN